MKAIEVEATPVKAQETALAAPESPEVRMSLLRGGTPAEKVSEVTAYADALADVIEKKRLYAVIKNKKHVLVEGWTFLGSMLGVYPVVCWSKPVMEDSRKVGWEARVEARTISGSVVGAAEASCLRSEPTWSVRDDYALRSMAQTRATAKALRLPLGFIVSSAGYEATPAEEMPRDAGGSHPQAGAGHPPPQRPGNPPAQPLTGKSTEEHLAEAKQKREEALEQYTKPFSEQLEESIKAARKRAGKPDSVPEFCPKCEEPVHEFMSSTGAGFYFECVSRHDSRQKMKGQGEKEADIRKVLAGHFFEWHSRKKADGSLPTE